MSVRANQVVFEVGGVVLSSRLIDGQFPNYRQLLPDAYEHELRLAGGEISEVVRRISLLAQKNAPLRLAFTEGELTVSARTPDVGEARETMPVPFAGEPLEIGFNPEFLRDGLEAVEAGDVAAEADLAAAAGPDRGRRRLGLPVPPDADPAERVDRSADVIATRLTLRDFRSYEAADVRLGPGLTVVSGRNGAGKTNLLEALYFACTGRSCRTANEREVVRFGAELTRLELALRGRARPPRGLASASSPASRSGCAPTARRWSSLAGVDGAAAGRPSSCPTGWSSCSARRRCAARTSTRSSPRCGRPAPARAAPTPPRSRSATRCWPRSAPAAPRAPRCRPGTPSSPATASR